MTCNSLIVNLKTKQSTLLPTSHVSIQCKQSLTVFRGQSFFSSACLLTNNNQSFLFCLKDHYTRLMDCFKELFESAHLPFSLAEFEGYINKIIINNDIKKQAPLSCKMLCVAGQKCHDHTHQLTYSSGFGGHLDQLIFIVQPFTKKPSWVFKKGLNLCSLEYQRPFANVKLTNYLGGVIGQHQIDAINAWACMLHLNSKHKSFFMCLKTAINNYQELTLEQQKIVRIIINSMIFSNEETKEIADYKQLIVKIPQAIQTLFLAFTEENKKLINKHMKLNEQDLLHETLFTSTNNQSVQYLEGSTFSLLAINKKDEFVVVPLTDPHKNKINLDLPVILESISINYLIKHIKLNQLPYKIQQINYDTLDSFKAIFCVSSTRTFTNKGQFDLQPCRSIDGKIISQSPSVSVDILKKSIQNYISTTVNN